MFDELAKSFMNDEQLEALITDMRVGYTKEKMEASLLILGEIILPHNPDISMALRGLVNYSETGETILICEENEGILIRALNQATS